MSLTGSKNVLAQPERVLEPELMDQPELAVLEHHEALRGLGRINLLSLAPLAFRGPLLELAHRCTPSQPLRVLDVACGGGDASIWVAGLAKRKGLSIEVTGADISAEALNFAARRANAKQVAIEWMQRDLVAKGLPEGFDVVLCSLFLHHLTQAQALGLFREMAAHAGKAALVSDLLRTKPGLWLAKVVPPMVSRSYVVHVDAVLSARSAYSMGEVRQMADAAGLGTATLSRRWPERFFLDWRRGKS